MPRQWEPIRLNRLLRFPPTAAIQTRLTLARRRRHIKLMIFIHECLALTASLEAGCFASALPKCGVRLPRRNHSLRFGCFLISDQVSTSDRSLLELGCRRPSIRGLEDRRLKLRIIACLQAQQFRGRSCWIFLVPDCGACFAALSVERLFSN